MDQPQAESTSDSEGQLVPGPLSPQSADQVSSFFLILKLGEITIYFFVISITKKCIFKATY